MFPRGIYVLVLRVNGKLKVGKLGEINFRGRYAYIGSNQRGGRIERHLRKGKKKKWHIDYLTEVGEVEKVIVLPGLCREFEEKLAKKLEKFECVRGFGNSDCRDRSHLFKFSDKLEKEVMGFAKENGVRPEVFELK